MTVKPRLIAAIALSSLMLWGCGEESNTDIPDITDPSGDTVPELPADPQEGSTSFTHRILLLQHTGTYCPNCPRLMSSLKELSEDKEYNGLYHHVAAHSYNEEGDAAYSTAAANLSQAFCSGYYPELTFNLTTANTGTSTDVSSIKENIDRLIKETADAGISASAALDGNIITVHAEIKAAKEGAYRIAAWLLEDGIESEQEGASESWQHIHNNAVRAMAGSSLNLRIYGEKTGTLSPGSKAGKTFIITMEEGWNAENCKILILANATDSNGKVDIVNCAICPIGENVEYEYR